VIGYTVGYYTFLFSVFVEEIVMKCFVGITGLALVFGSLGQVEAESMQWQIADGGNGHWYEVIVAPSLISGLVRNLVSVSRNG